MAKGSSNAAAAASDEEARLASMAWRLGVVTSLGSIGLGVLMLVWPGRTLLVIAVVIGIQLIAWGLGLVVSRAVASEGAGHTILGIIAGVAVMVFGLATLRVPGRTLALMALFLGVSWFLAGVMELIETVRDRGAPHRGWRTAGGLITALSGFVVLVVPVGSALALAVWGGLLMIAVGASRLPVALRMRKTLRSG